MRELDPERRRALDELRRRYRDQLPERMRQIQSAVARFEETPDDRATGDALYRMVHTLAGSAAIYGFEAASGRALALERAVLARLGDPARATAPLQALFDAVRAEMI